MKVVIRCACISLCVGTTSANAQPQATVTLIDEIIALESPDWPPRVRCMRWRAVYWVEIMSHRWAQALHAAETALELAIQAGATLLKGVCSNAVLLALTAADDIDTALERSVAVRHHVVPGPATTVILYIGSCARLKVLKGDLAAARDLLGQMFDLCRTVDWSHFDLFCQVYFRLALQERRPRVSGTSRRLRRTGHRKHLADATLRATAAGCPCGVG